MNTVACLLDGYLMEDGFQWTYSALSQNTDLNDIIGGDMLALESGSCARHFTGMTTRMTQISPALTGRVLLDVQA